MIRIIDYSTLFPVKKKSSREDMDKVYASLKELSNRTNIGIITAKAPKEE